MSVRQTVWVDVSRCTGCGACVEICPVGAVRLVYGIASVHEAACTGCEACVDACPQEAIQPLVHGEIVAAQERLAPNIRLSGSLAETAGVAVAAATVGLLTRFAKAVAGMAGRWFAQALADGRQVAQVAGTAARSSLGQGRTDLSVSRKGGGSPTVLPSPPSRGRDERGRGLQARRRRRGR
jgi:NAD-dependent dihydropyrimidine dehydrogenase PreA subunit